MLDVKVLRRALIHKWGGPATSVEVACSCTEDTQTHFPQKRKIMFADRIWHVNSAATVLSTLDRDLFSEVSYGLHLKLLPAIPDKCSPHTSQPVN